MFSHIEKFILQTDGVPQQTFCLCGLLLPNDSTLQPLYKVVGKFFIRQSIIR